MKINVEESVMDVFGEGLFARALGYSRSRNPYPEDSLNHKFWHHGWAWIDGGDVELSLAETYSKTASGAM
jgi:hypothetical protein